MYWGFAERGVEFNEAMLYASVLGLLLYQDDQEAVIVLTRGQGCIRC
ncbi:MAG: hypothetical protein QXF49_04355 [Thermosphaera sp.]